MAENENHKSERVRGVQRSIRTLDDLRWHCNRTIRQTFNGKLMTERGRTLASLYRVMVDVLARSDTAGRLAEVEAEVAKLMAVINAKERERAPSREF